MKLKINWILFACLFVFFTESSFAADAKNSKRPYLSCSVVKERIGDFLKYHYVFRDFNETLSDRTYGMYFKILDPGKLYFLQSDIDSFSSSKKDLGSKINDVDCRFIVDVYQLYQKRVGEATTTALDILKNTKFNFTATDFIETDRKKIPWAKSSEELKERWKKTVKFVVFNMKDTDNPKTISERLKKRYLAFQKRMENRSSDEVNALFLNAFALSLDPHSVFLTPQDNAQFQIDFSLKLVGIGATLVSPEGYTTIDAVVPGGAAAKSGKLKRGDKIIAVDAGDGAGMQDVIDMDLDKVVQLIRGKEGTPVKLLILRKEGGQVKRFQVQLTRALVQIKDYEAKSDVTTLGGKKIGVINLPSFYIDYKDCQENPFTCRSSANDMAREIKKLKAQNVDGIVLDLRRNGGGDLSEAQKIVGLFIPDPIVTQIEDRDKQVRSLDIDAKPIYTGPLAVLISRYTASASEILAGAVQDYGRGLIVGDSRTFGKGTVQTVIEVPGTAGRQTNGAIHVTIAKFFRPSGKSNQEKGILSDVVIPDVLDATDVGESESDYALPYTTIKPAIDFKPKPTFDSGVFSKLSDMSSKRVKKSAEFKDILTAMKKVESERKSTSVSLKETSLKGDAKKKEDKNIENGLDDKLPDFSVKVIRKDDAMLKEAGNILVDCINMIKNKTNWAHNAQ